MTDIDASSLPSEAFGVRVAEGRLRTVPLQRAASGDRMRGRGCRCSAGAPGRRRGNRHGHGDRRAPKGIPGEPHALMTAERPAALLRGGRDILRGELGRIPG